MNAASLPVMAELTLGQVLAASGYFRDAQDAAKAAVKVLAGAELGLGPVASMRGVDIIKGEVSLSAGLVAALVRRSERYDYQVTRWDDTGCTLVFLRDGQALEPPSSFGTEDAQRAGLGGDNYRKYPRNMFFARAMTNGARLHCPDLFAGSVYVPDELEGSEPQAAVRASAAAVVPPEPTTVAGELPQAQAAQASDERDAGAAMQQQPPAATPAEETRAWGDLITEAEATRLRELAQLQGVTPGWLQMALINLGVDDVGDPVAALGALTVGQAAQLMEAINRRG